MSTTSTARPARTKKAAGTHKIVPHDEWLKARVAFLEKEKEFTRGRDQLNAARRALPWEKVGTPYVFRNEAGEHTLGDLFEKRPQLIVYHFMFGPGWDEGCKSCSYLADHFDGMLPHLHARNTTFAAVSRAPIEKFLPFKRRMGWKFPWYSSFGSSFNRDFHVSFTEAEIASGKMEYNYTQLDFPGDEAPGMSVFYRSDAGGRAVVYHTYSAYGRGLDILIGAYNFLDHTPLGRDEDGLENPMSWIRHHDKYPG